MKNAILEKSGHLHLITPPKVGETPVKIHRFDDVYSSGSSGKVHSYKVHTLDLNRY